MSEPITTALRGLLCAKPKGDPCWDAMDAIDAVHAALEAENAALRAKVEELDNGGGSMHDGGSITSELREWWVSKFPVMDKELHNDFMAIADRIDAEHESACKRERGEGIRIAEEAALEEMAEYGLVHKNKDLDPATLARSLRRMAGDGGMEWVYEPMQTRVLIDAADMLDENAKLRELVRAAWRCIHTEASCSDCRLIAGGCTLQTAMRELRVEVDA